MTKKKTTTAKTNPSFTEETQMKNMARTLHAELSSFAQDLTYCQVLEALSRAQGSRTLHVYQAKKPVELEGRPLKDAARRMAARLFFKSLGSWAGKHTELLHELDQAFAAQDEKGGRFVEARVHELTQQKGPVEVKPAFEHLRHDEWKTQFESLVQELTESLAQEAGVSPFGHEVGTLHKGLMRDWRVGEGELDSSAPEAAPFEVTVGRNYNSQQFYVDITRPGLQKAGLEGTPQLSLFIEVNQGVPCVHLTNEVYADQLLSVFATQDGLYIRPDAPAEDVFLRGTPALESLAKLHEANGPHPLNKFNLHLINQA